MRPLALGTPPGPPKREKAEPAFSRLGLEPFYAYTLRAASCPRTRVTLRAIVSFGT